MPVITSIKQQKNKNRANVYLDNKFGFGIDLDNLVLLDLRVGRDLSEEQIKNILKKSEFQKILDKLYRFATIRPRSQKEINQWFKKKEVPDSIQKELTDRLKHNDLIDDRKFALWWVDQRITFGKKSKKVLKLELRQKGIDSNTIEDVLAQTGVNEEKTALELLAKKMYKWENLDDKTRRQKISQYLLGKGFSWEVVEKVI